MNVPPPAGNVTRHAPPGPLFPRSPPPGCRDKPGPPPLSPFRPSGVDGRGCGRVLYSSGGESGGTAQGSGAWSPPCRYPHTAARPPSPGGAESGRGPSSRAARGGPPPPRSRPGRAPSLAPRSPFAAWHPAACWSFWRSSCGPRRASSPPRPGGRRCGVPRAASPPARPIAPAGILAPLSFSVRAPVRGRASSPVLRPGRRAVGVGGPDQSAANR